MGYSEGAIETNIPCLEQTKTCRLPVSIHSEMLSLSESVHSSHGPETVQTSGPEPTVRRATVKILSDDGGDDDDESFGSWVTFFSTLRGSIIRNNILLCSPEAIALSPLNVRKRNMIPISSSPAEG